MIHVWVSGVGREMDIYMKELNIGFTQEYMFNGWCKGGLTDIATALWSGKRRIKGPTSLVLLSLVLYQRHGQ